MAKVVQNIHRDVNIAIANEISDAALLLNVDSKELQTLTNVNPRVNMLNAGPGVGGYCLPNALSYLKNAQANVVHITENKPFDGVNSIYLDNYNMIYEGVKFINSKGYEEIYYLYVKIDNVHDRVLGYRAAINDLNK
jgi:UDP-glucose 6-dehydrogenase